MNRTDYDYATTFPNCDLDPEALLRTDVAAQFLSMSNRALEAWRHRGGGPPFVRISSRAIRYRRKDLIVWAAQRAQS
jgi:hypothetical protein